MSENGICLAVDKNYMKANLTKMIITCGICYNVCMQKLTRNNTNKMAWTVNLHIYILICFWIWDYNSCNLQNTIMNYNTHMHQYKYIVGNITAQTSLHMNVSIHIETHWPQQLKKQMCIYAKCKNSLQHISNAKSYICIYCWYC